jgi:hypothetical protein
MYQDGTDILQDLVVLTKEEIITAGAPIKFGRADAQTQKHLVETVVQLLPHDQERI